MSLSPGSQYCLDAIWGDSEVMATNICTNTMNAVVGLLAGENRQEMLSATPAFDRDGVYALRMAPGDEGAFRRTWNHDLAIVCVGGEATVYQSWVDEFSLSDWLLNSDPGNAALHACADRFSPRSGRFQNDPAAGIAAWRRALITFQTAWNANFQADGEGDGGAVEEACRVAFGGEIGRFYRLVKNKVLTTHWYRYPFRKNISAELGLETEPAVSVFPAPAVRTSTRKRSK